MSENYGGRYNDVKQAMDSASDNRKSTSAIIGSGIILNATTTTKIANNNPQRKFLLVSNSSNNRSCWIKLQAANIDNDHKGILLNDVNRGKSTWSMSDNIYTGEVSAIADAGSPVVYVTEY